MKRLKLLIVVLLIAHGLSFGQLMVNGDFAINAGNDGGISAPCCGICVGASCSACTFTTGSVPNWRVLFGSPNFHGLDFVSFPGCMSMASTGNLSEAVVGNYPFVSGQLYEIHICAKELVNGKRIRIIAGKGTPPFDLNAGDIPCGPDAGAFCKGHIPIPNPVPTSSTTMQEIAHADFALGDNFIYYTPDDNYQWIAVFPQGADDCVAALTMSYCWVFPYDFFDHTVFPSAYGNTWTSSYNPLDPRLYYGSVLEIQPNSVQPKITNDPYHITTFKATQEVLIDVDPSGYYFLATADKEGYFLAEIDRQYNFLNLCSPAHHDGGKEGFSDGGRATQTAVTEILAAQSQGLGNIAIGAGNQEAITGSKPAGILGTDDHEGVRKRPFTNRIIVEPNPVKDKLYFVYSPSGSEMVDVFICDALGREVYKAHFGCASPNDLHETIDLSELIDGLYFVTIKSGNQQAVKKITKL